MTDARIEINGTHLNTRIDGPDGAPGVVLGNSLATNLNMWEALVAALTPDYRVLRFDKRGHGASDAGDAPISIESLADDAVALAREFGFTGGHYVGLSIGGMIGQAIGLNHPDAFRSLTLCATTSQIPVDMHPIWEERIAAVEADGMEPMVAPTLERWFTAGYRDAEPDKVAAVGEMVRRTSVDGYVRCSKAIMQLDYTARLSNVTTPTLVVPGELDPALPPAMSEVIRDAIPGAAMETVAGAAHLCNIEKAGDFNAIVRRFLGAH